MSVTKNILNSQVINGVAVLGFEQAGLREEKQVLLALESLRRYVVAKQELKILLNMSSVQHLSSLGIGQLIRILRNVKDNGGILKLCCLQEHVLELFEVMRLDQVFELFPDIERAIASFESAHCREPGS